MKRNINRAHHLQGAPKKMKKMKKTLITQGLSLSSLRSAISLGSIMSLIEASVVCSCSVTSSYTVKHHHTQCHIIIHSDTSSRTVSHHHLPRAEDSLGTRNIIIRSVTSSYIHSVTSSPSKRQPCRLCARCRAPRRTAVDHVPCWAPN